MLPHIHLENVLVIDIETVPAVPDFNSLSPIMQNAWEQKMTKYREEHEDVREHYFRSAGIYAEFGKIICISAGAFFVNKQTGVLNFRIKSFSGHDEKKVLIEFSELLNLHYNDFKKHLLCGHNGKEFDFPYLCRRMLVHSLLLPRLLDISGLKPWDVAHLDTMELWKFGDKKNFTSLNLLAALFQIPSPKIGIDGSQVGGVYWKEDNLEKIVEYCQRDVLTVAQLLLKFKGMPVLNESEVTFVK